MRTIRTVTCMIVLVAALIVTELIAPAPPSQAVVDSEASRSGYDLIMQAHEELEAAAIRSEPREAAAGPAVLYTLEDNVQIALEVPTDPEMLGTDLYVGSDRGGHYVSFNATDQAALVNGSAAALGAALCLAGPAACILGAGVVAAAFTYLQDGSCPGNQELWAYFRSGPTGPDITRMVCRPVSYPGGG